MIKSKKALSIDMVVKMPESIFQEKDFLNYRYFYKRAYYIAYIAAGLQESAENEFTLEFEYLNGNDLQPILIAKPALSKSRDQGFIESQLNDIRKPIYDRF
jgi:U3 small nucleolar RNA-associated protein 22